MKKETGGSAFPQQTVDFGNGPESPDSFAMGGMTMRDWFASQALKGLSSAHKAEDGTWAIYGCEKEAAELSYRLADAMLAERSKE